MVQYLNSSSASADYVMWQRDHEDVRSYLINTNHGMGPWFDDKWAAADERATATFDPDHDDVSLIADLFEDAVGVWPDLYFFQLSTAVVKDACTLFELFLEATANAVLSRYGGRLATLQSESSWHWNECELFFRHYLGTSVLTADVEAILWIRNKMTHLRLRLRTPAGLAEFKHHVATIAISGPPTSAEQALNLTENPSYFSGPAYLSQLETLRLLDKIADNVSRIASVAFQFEYGTATTPYLTAVSAGAPLTIPAFSNAKYIAT